MQTLLYFAIWGVLIFLIMRFGCGSHVMGHRGHTRSRTDDESKSAGIRGTETDKAVDPVCGMIVIPKDAESAVHAGTTYYFCSPTCREKFVTSPSTYLATGGHVEHEEHHHG